MPLVFVDLVGREDGEHTGQRGKIKVGLESKFNKDEARKIVKFNNKAHAVMKYYPYCLLHPVGRYSI